MSSTLIGWKSVRVISDDELNLLFDILDIWRDRVSLKYGLTSAQRATMIVRHSEIIRGVR